jgi:hypothetical protein
MSPMKIIGFVAGGACLAALVGGGIYWWRRRKQQASGDRPQAPKRTRPGPDFGDLSDESDEPTDTRPRGHLIGKAELHPELREALDEEFADGWPPDDATIDSLEPDDVVVFAVESEPVGNYTETREELVNAKVLSVEETVVRGRVVAPVAHAEHHGSHAGHGFRVGDLVEVPRAQVLVAARPTGPVKEGYNSQGRAARTLEPSDLTGETYRVRPGTPYDLVLPYRTDELKWHFDRDMVKMVHIGHKGSLEQVMFTEDSMRGKVTVRALDRDPKEGLVFVARWQFVIDA